MLAVHSNSVMTWYSQNMKKFLKHLLISHICLSLFLDCAEGSGPVPEAAVRMEAMALGDGGALNLNY